MTVAVRGRVPRWAAGDKAEHAAQHIQERLQALERALAGGAPTFLAPSVPIFGGGPVPGGGSGGGGGGGGGGGVTDHGLLAGLLDDDHPQYVEFGEPLQIGPHQHGPFDVAGLEGRFVNRGERVLPPHTHGPQDILGSDQRQRVQMVAHPHVMGDVADLRGDDVQFVLASRIFGG